MDTLRWLSQPVCAVNGLCKYSGQVLSGWQSAGIIVCAACLLLFAYNACCRKSARAMVALCALVTVIAASLTLRLNRDLAREQLDVDGGQSTVSPLDEAFVRRIDSLFTQFACSHVYLDVGSNIGVQIRKLFQPRSYPGAPVTALFDEQYGSRSRCERVCAIGLEPNPKHAARLDELQRRMREAGAGVLIEHAAASTRSGTVRFGVDSKEKANHHWAAAIDAAGGAFGAGIDATGGEMVTVPALDLSALLRAVRARMSPNGRLVMKLDIEGHELRVWPHLRATGAACLSNLTFVEWHIGNAPKGMSAAQVTDLASVKRGANAMHGNSKELRDQVGQRAARWVAWLRERHSSAQTCPTKLIEMDDETHSDDGVPWPAAGSLCAAPRNGGG